MPSLTDLDQGGTFRPYNRVWMGNGIGWVQAPAAIVRVSAGGTTILQLGVSVVVVNFNGAVTIQLPVFKGTVTAPQSVLPGVYVPMAITIQDTGGFAQAHPITILPGSGETISGLASITINSNYGGYVVMPDPVNGSSTVVS